MTSMAVIEVVTYICAVLGGILLLLCIILAAFFIYFQCRKLRNSGSSGNRQYVIVPRGDNPGWAENGQAGGKDCAVAGNPLVTLTADNLQDDSLDRQRRTRPTSLATAPPVKKKLLWRKKKKSHDRSGAGSEALFTPEDFEEARRVEPLFRKKRRGGADNADGLEGKYRRRSKSEWDLSDTLPPGQSPTVPELSFFGRETPVPTYGGSGDMGKSQYFDALDTIDEEDQEGSVVSGAIEDEEERRSLPPEQQSLLKRRLFLKSSDDSQQWEDLPALEGIPEETSMQLKRFISQSKALRKRRQALENPAIQRRVNAMKNLTASARRIEQGFFAELSQIENRYRAGRLGQLGAMRQKLVSGEDKANPCQFGVPYFWLHAMLQCDTLSSIVQEHDREVLKYLVDIRIVSRAPPRKASSVSNSTTSSSVQQSSPRRQYSPHDFTLEFQFASNEYFNESVLTKEYDVECNNNPRDLQAYPGPEITGCRGCKIRWNRGKNMTLRAVKKLDRVTGQPVQKWARRNSFFNFFNPPLVNPGAAPEDQENARKAQLLEAHFEIGLHLKETFISKATYFFLSEMEEGVAVPPKAANHARRGSLHVPSLVNNNHKNVPEKSVSMKLSGTATSSLNTTLDGGSVASSSHVSLSVNNLMSSKSTDIMSDELHNGHAADAATPAPLHGNGGLRNSSNEAQPVDPIIGRYRMETSECFDEYMKALGVGMMKRKMANSVTPVNVVEIDSMGLYTIRTETTLRTSEIQFRLNQFFSEPTLDGRVTQTMPSRTGNVIVLDQKGNNTKGEKDSRMIRDFRGDAMHMQLIVDNVVCKRVYRRVTADNE